VFTASHQNKYHELAFHTFPYIVSESFHSKTYPYLITSAINSNIVNLNPTNLFHSSTFPDTFRRDMDNVEDFLLKNDHKSYHHLLSRKVPYVTNSNDFVYGYVAHDLILDLEEEYTIGTSGYTDEEGDDYGSEDGEDGSDDEYDMDDVDDHDDVGYK
jgi:hypothetical protein